jgi:hypothetical protein
MRSEAPFTQSHPCVVSINNFIDFAGRAGVHANDLFQTVSLFEGSNMTQVRLCGSDGMLGADLVNKQVLQTLDNLKRKTG